MLSFPKQQILGSSKLKEFADNNFKFDENGGNLYKRVGNTGENEKLLVMCNFSFSRSVFKRLVLTRKKPGLLGQGLKAFEAIADVFFFPQF